MRKYGVDGVELDASDRGNGALRKAKYLVRYRPTYFSISAIGMRLDYHVDYADNQFTLTGDMVPLA